MNDYSFWANLFYTFQVSPDWIKALWLLVPPGFLLGLMALLMWSRRACLHRGDVGKTEVPYAFPCEDHDSHYCISHGRHPEEPSAFTIADASNRA